MRAVVITKHGGPEVLRVEERPDPRPRPDEVAIEVKAAGLNFAEVMARMGLYPDAPKTPCVVGYEVAGLVEGTGERVIAGTRFGGHADRVVAPRGGALHPRPPLRRPRRPGRGPAGGRHAAAAVPFLRGGGRPPGQLRHGLGGA